MPVRLYGMEAREFMAANTANDRLWRCLDCRAPNMETFIQHVLEDICQEKNVVFSTESMPAVLEIIRLRASYFFDRIAETVENIEEGDAEADAEADDATDADADGSPEAERPKCGASRPQ